MVRFTKSKKSAVAEPSLPDPATTLNIMVHGDADSGKSFVLRRFADQNNAPTVDEQQSSYWMTQQLPEPVFVDYNGVRVRFQEVPGSRGRMSNYHSLATAYDVADAVIFCASLSQEHSYTDNLTQLFVWGDQTITTLTRSSSKAVVNAKPAFALGTMADIKTESYTVDQDTLLADHNMRYYEVSAVTNAGIQTAFQEIMEQCLERTSKGRQLLAASKANPAPTATTTMATMAAENKIAAPSMTVWEKLHAMFSSSSKPIPAVTSAITTTSTALAPVA